MNSDKVSEEYDPGLTSKQLVFTLTNRMANGYTKLFADIVTSTIWQTPNDCRVLWVTMLALKDEHNICRATVPSLAKICDITPEKCEEYLEHFQQPDKYSRSQDYEGRRIQKADGGWLILNGQKYRDMLRSQDRRDYVRKKVAEHRSRRGSVNSGKQSNQCKPISEEEEEAQAEANREQSPKRRQQQSRKCDADWITELASVPAYQNIDIQTEISKAQTWCETHHRQCTRRFFLNWLNRVEKPLTPVKKPYSLEPLPWELPGYQPPL